MPAIHAFLLRPELLKDAGFNPEVITVTHLRTIAQKFQRRVLAHPDFKEVFIASIEESLEPGYGKLSPDDIPSSEEPTQFKAEKSSESIAAQGTLGDINNALEGTPDGCDPSKT